MLFRHKGLNNALIVPSTTIQPSNTKAKVTINPEKLDLECPNIRDD